MKQAIKLRESDLKRIIAESVRSVVNESLSQSHEDSLRQMVGKYALQIKNMLDQMTTVGHTGNNSLGDLLAIENSSIVDKLYDVYFEMQDFAKTTDQRRKKEEDFAETPLEGWEDFGY